MKQPTFDKTPICEVCNKEPATSFSYFQNRNKWLFCGQCTTKEEDYYIELRRFFNNPSATVDWLAHMQEKNWMNWPDFMDMMHRFRDATRSFFKS